MLYFNVDREMLMLMRIADSQASRKKPELHEHIATVLRFVEAVSVSDVFHFCPWSFFCAICITFHLRRSCTIRLTTDCMCLRQRRITTRFTKCSQRWTIMLCYLTGVFASAVFDEKTFPGICTCSRDHRSNLCQWQRKCLTRNMRSILSVC